MIRQQKLASAAATARAELTKIIEGSAAYSMIADYYEFTYDFNGVRVTGEDILRADERLPSVLGYLRSRTDGMAVLKRTLVMWADPRDMIFLTENEKSGCCIARDAIPSIETSDISGIYYIDCSCEVLERVSFAPHIWISGPTYKLKGTFEVDAKWIEKHFKDGNAKLEVGVALGLSRTELAALLYAPETTCVGALPTILELS